MSIGAVGGASAAAQATADVQQAVALKTLKLANDQADNILTLIEGAAEAAQAISEDGHVDVQA